jgi:hypothetical protein
MVTLLSSAPTFFDRPVFRDFPAFSPQLVTSEAPDPHHKHQSFSACVAFVAGVKNLSSHRLLVLIEEAALICGHGSLANRHDQGSGEMNNQVSG